ncbi:hypothetical protein ECANGB1_1482 [Enterospora canceri]|uniref:Uncharacterized protein n=1 Tax=Enterospora canceri TaxID=1081671 RepID=A0A1Y1S5Z1_9MICR|nr:hypothetical protein ECANGB1_1482 [Enterospora canceri]
MKFIESYKNCFTREMNNNLALKREMDRVKEVCKKLDIKIESKPKKVYFWNRPVEENGSKFIIEKEFMDKHMWFRNNRLLGNMMNDYYKLTYIEQQLIPEILHQNIKLGVKEVLANAEVTKNIKRMRDELLESVDWNDKEVIVDEIRRKEVKNIAIKNLKKTITASFEITIAVYGKKRSVKQNKHHSCTMEFTKEDGVWKASNFTYTELY